MQARVFLAYFVPLLAKVFLAYLVPKALAIDNTQPRKGWIRLTIQTFSVCLPYLVLKSNEKH